MSPKIFFFFAIILMPFILVNSAPTGTLFGVESNRLNTLGSELSLGFRSYKVPNLLSSTNLGTVLPPTDKWTFNVQSKFNTFDPSTGRYFLLVGGSFSFELFIYYLSFFISLTFLPLLFYFIFILFEFNLI